MTDKTIGRIIGVTLVVGFLLGWTLWLNRDAVRAPEPVETTDVRQAVPPPELVTAAHTAAGTAVPAALAAKYVAVAESCRTPGHGKVPYCWWGGWTFAKKTVCVAYSVPNTPIAAIIKAYNGVAGIRVIDGKGNCIKLGYTRAQSIAIQLYTAADRAGSMKGACAYTAPGSYGNLTSMLIRVNVTGIKRTACGGDPEWTDVFNHEVGHAFGFTHSQPAVSSIMRDGHTLDANDRAELTILYGKRSA